MDVRNEYILRQLFHLDDGGMSQGTVKPVKCALRSERLVPSGVCNREVRKGFEPEIVGGEARDGEETSDGSGARGGIGLTQFAFELTPRRLG